MSFKHESIPSVDVELFQGGFVAAFGLSKPPAVFQLDLTKNTGVSLLLREEGSIWNLGFVEAGKPFTVVASFDRRDEGEDAFDIVREAMMQCRMRKRSFWDWLKILFLSSVGVVVLLFALRLLIILLPTFSFGDVPVQNQPERMSLQETVPQPPIPEVTYGTPLSAEDVLSAPDRD